MRTSFALALALMALPAAAQEEVEEDKGATKRRARDFESEIIREIERGYYLKGGAGSTQFLLDFSGILSPVMGLNLSIGQDFVDRERMSVSWEVAFQQGLQNGPKYDERTNLAQTNTLIQGDVHTFAALGILEVSGYLSRRFGLGVRAGGGVMVMPLLIPAATYESDFVSTWGDEAAAHAGPLPAFGGGPTIEHYTKLSHFSLGADVDVLYVVNFDLGIAPSGYLKYTF